MLHTEPCQTGHFLCKCGLADMCRRVAEWHTCLRRRRLHGVVVQYNVLQLPQLPVGRWDLRDLVAGEVQTDEREVGQLCGRRHNTGSLTADTRE